MVSEARTVGSRVGYVRLAIERAFARPSLRTVIAIAVAIFAASVWLGWTGYIGSDDGLYASAALSWLDGSRYLGTTHWALRLTTVLPIAGSFLLFGVNELALILPTLAYGLATVIVLSVVAYRLLGPKCAPITAVLFASAPMFALSNSTAGVDLAELFFDLLALCLFITAMESSRRRLLLVLCGVFLAFGWMSRETTIFLIASLGLFFLAGAYFRRVEYLFIATGFLAVAGSEILIYYFATGDALYRIGIDYHHDLVNRDATQGLFDPSGNLHAGGIADPLLMILLNKNFGFLFWLAIPAGVWLVRSRSMPAKLRRAVSAIAIAGLVWMVGISACSGKLFLDPRYVLFSVGAASMLVAAWITYEVFPHSRFAGFAMVGIMLAVNLLAILLDNHNFMFPERTLVAYARNAGRMIYTDPETYRRAEFLLACDGLTSRVTDRQHHLGDLFYYVPSNARVKERKAGHVIETRATYAPLSGEKIVAEFNPRQQWPGRALTAVGASKFIPGPLMQKFSGGDRGAYIYLKQ
jgi:4-amino-4-deoxy-L-arabinose transferase-like glycosyltransferase